MIIILGISKEELIEKYQNRMVAYAENIAGLERNLAFGGTRRKQEERFKMRIILKQRIERAKTRIAKLQGE